MNNTMIAQTYLPHQFVDPRKLNFRMNPYEMANQQAQMQQIFLRQQMQQRTPIMLATAPQLSGAASQQQRRVQKAKPVKRVIAVNLPEDLQTIESVTSTFYPYGEILLARVLRPNKQLPFDLKQFQAKIPDLGRSVCAIIEFESAQAAKFAVETLKFRTQELKFRLALLEPGVSHNLFLCGRNTWAKFDLFHGVLGTRIRIPPFSLISISFSDLLSSDWSIISPWALSDSSIDSPIGLVLKDIKETP
jgi:hypothetical protein